MAVGGYLLLGTHSNDNHFKGTVNMKRSQPESEEPNSKRMCPNQETEENKTYQGTSLKRFQNGSVKIQQQYFIKMNAETWENFTKVTESITANWDCLEEGRWPLNEKLHATLSKFKENFFVHIREWYPHDDILKPSKVGVWFTRKTWDQFLLEIPKMYSLADVTAGNSFCYMCYNQDSECQQRSHIYQSTVAQFCKTAAGQELIKIIKEEITKDLDLISKAYHGTSKEKRYESLAKENVLEKLSKYYLLENSEVCYMLTTDELFNVLKEYLHYFIF